MRVTVNSSRKAYDVVVERGLLAGLDKASGKALVVTQPGARRYAEAVAGSVGVGGESVFVLPDGEDAKSLESVKDLYGFALEQGLDRDDLVYAVGGGCVGDAAGFFASTFKRGLRLVHVPTTLVAQVDSSIGGKVAVNFGGIKNVVGLVYPPEAVYCDVDTLASLDVKNVRNGVAEVIKYGLVLDAGFFEKLEQGLLELVLSKDAGALEGVVGRCVTLKAGVVGIDEFDCGERMKLNYGHTVGHAVELLTGVQHGYAVSVGMAAAGLVAKARGMISAKVLSRQTELLASAGLPLVAREVSAEEVLEKMKGDKKRVDGRMRMVLLDGLGSCRVCGVEEKEVAYALREVLK